MFSPVFWWYTQLLFLKWIHLWLPACPIGWIKLCQPWSGVAYQGVAEWLRNFLEHRNNKHQKTISSLQAILWILWQVEHTVPHLVAMNVSRHRLLEASVEPRSSRNRLRPAGNFPGHWSFGSSRGADFESSCVKIEHLTLVEVLKSMEFYWKLNLTPWIHDEF